MLILKNKNQTRQIEELQKQLDEKNNEINVLKAQLMQNQIRPHFIFNALLAIKQLCIENPKAAATAIQNFSGYLRTNLEAMTQTECVPFSMELACIRQYVALEKSDPASVFNIVYDIQYEDFKLPLLTIQPAVENAVRHGVANKGSKGVVTLTSKKDGSNVIVIVSDNGDGFTSMTKQQVEHRSVAVENTKERLKLLCGGEINIINKGHGTDVIFTIPL